MLACLWEQAVDASWWWCVCGPVFFGPGTKRLLGPGGIDSPCASAQNVGVSPTYRGYRGKKPRLEKWVSQRAGPEAGRGWLCPSGSEPGAGGCLGVV